MIRPRQDPIFIIKHTIIIVIWNRISFALEQLLMNKLTTNKFKADKKTINSSSQWIKKKWHFYIMLSISKFTSTLQWVTLPAIPLSTTCKKSLAKKPQMAQSVIVSDSGNYRSLSQAVSVSDITSSVVC